MAERIEGKNISVSDVQNLNGILGGCIEPLLKELDLHGYESGVNTEFLSKKFGPYIDSLFGLLQGCGYRKSDIISGMLDIFRPFIGIKESPDSIQLTPEDNAIEPQETFRASLSRDININIKKDKFEKMISLISKLTDSINSRYTKINIGNASCNGEIIKFNPLEIEFCLLDLEDLYNNGNSYVKKRNEVDEKNENKKNIYVVDGDFMKSFNSDNIQGWKSPNGPEIAHILKELKSLYPSIFGTNSLQDEVIAFFMLLTHITGNIILSDGRLLRCTSSCRGFVEPNKKNFGKVLLMRTPPSVKYSRLLFNSLLQINS